MFPVIGKRRGEERSDGCEQAFEPLPVQEQGDLFKVLGAGGHQALLAHKDVQATMIYAHVLNQGGEGVLRPLEDL